jgi:predicted protein tyrosine phosphatase
MLQILALVMADLWKHDRFAASDSVSEESSGKASMIQVTRVWERLFLGGRNDAENIFRSNPFKITTVVSLCEEQVLRHTSGVNYIHLPIADDKRIEVGQFDAIIDALGENIRWGTVLLHCGSGVSRAPVLAAAWMQVVGYKNIDGALEEIASLRPIITPSGILLSSVKRHLM